MHRRYKISRKKISNKDYQELCVFLQSLIDKVRKQESKRKSNLVDVAVKYQREIIGYLTQKPVV